MSSFKNSFDFIYSTLLCISLVGVLYVNLVSGEDDDQGCSVSSDEGIQEDLLSYLRKHNMFGKQYTCKDPVLQNRKYLLSICGDASLKRPNAAIVFKNEVQPEVRAIGMRNDTTVYGVRNHWTLIVFGKGDPNLKGSVCRNQSMSSSLMIACEPDVSGDGELRVLYFDEPECHFLFELRTPDICGPQPGMSGWGIFYIICVVCLVCYFVLGALYMRFVKGAKGVDQIPNRTVWFGLGNKMADGCGIVCRCDQYCTPDPLDNLDAHSPSYSGGGYSPIGENAPITRGPQHMDRDTTLLNP